jgi:hypothetical protein
MVFIFILICNRTDQGYSAQLIISAKQTMLEEEMLREEDFVEDARLLGWASDDENWWSEIDEYDGPEVKASSKTMKFEGKSVQGQAMEDCTTEEVDLTATIMDVLSGDHMIKSDKRFLNEREQRKALDSLSERQR